MLPTTTDSGTSMPRESLQESIPSLARAGVLGGGEGTSVHPGYPLPEARGVLDVWSRGAGVPHLALDASLSSAGQELPLEFPHDRHWNPAGHAIAAGAIEEFLLRIQVFGQGPS